ncbi:hypothetical protein DsansV1_C23g0177771 [Dioscorea sansibarensis]
MAFPVCDANSTNNLDRFSPISTSALPLLCSRLRESKDLGALHSQSYTVGSVSHPQPKITDEVHTP